MCQDQTSCWKLTFIFQYPEGREQLEECIRLINTVIDFDASQTEDRVVPKHGISEELDELRETYEGLGSFLVREI